MKNALITLPRRAPLRQRCNTAMEVAKRCAAAGATPVSINATGAFATVHLDRHPAALVQTYALAAGTAYALLDGVRLSWPAGRNARAAR